MEDCLSLERVSRKFNLIANQSPQAIFPGEPEPQQNKLHNEENIPEQSVRPVQIAGDRSLLQLYASGDVRFSFRNFQITEAEPISQRDS